MKYEDLMRKRLIDNDLELAGCSSEMHERISSKDVFYDAALIWQHHIDAALCDRWLREFQSKYEYTEGTLFTKDGPQNKIDFRNNSRLEIWDKDLAFEMFYGTGRLGANTPAYLGGNVLVGPSEYIRLYKYVPGQYFKPHTEHPWIKNDTERTRAVILVYLNDDFEGGDTVFLDYGRVIRPKKGLVLGFQDQVLHEGEEVTSGEKYVLRFDLVYKKTGLDL
ncbi:2OG-Fe(II) oxygenase [Xanthomonas translucens]|uniref:2OG-Fe(II) oxygenase n=1 Tax=Xanthomonas campestris pv. translucens TaxID=343 RepID=UPI00083AD41C|nr:2OG-Fe(II) oxygenase [Xanthomonas translucens]